MGKFGGGSPVTKESIIHSIPHEIPSNPKSSVFSTYFPSFSTRLINGIVPTWEVGEAAFGQIYRKTVGLRHPETWKYLKRKKKMRMRKEDEEVGENSLTEGKKP